MLVVRTLPAAATGAGAEAVTTGVAVWLATAWLIQALSALLPPSEANALEAATRMAAAEMNLMVLFIVIPLRIAR